MSASREQKPGRLCAGAAKVDITPPAGTHLAGATGVYRPAEVVADPLFARATVFAVGGRKLCILALDITIITGDYTRRIRDAAERLGFERDAVMVHATQTHAAPPIGDFMLDPDFPEVPPEFEFVRGSERAYSNWAVERAIEAVRQAADSLRTVRVGCASAVREGLAFNRRGVRRDGTVCMPWFYSSKDKPLGPVDIRYLEGPTDPEVGVLCARDESMRPVALLLHYTCHPVNVFALTRNVVSADWPGAWCSSMAEACGEDAAPLVLNGCCGNINPWPAFTPDFTPDHRRMGSALAETAWKVLERMTFEEDAVLDWRRVEVPISIRQPDPKEVAAAETFLGEHPAPFWSDRDARRIDRDWFRASTILSVELMRRRSPTLAFEVQALRIGDTAIVGLPGEPFVEGQLAIKIGSPAAQTFVAHCCTRYVGYVPTREALTRGGHEVSTSYWAKLAPEALDMAVRESIRVLNDLFS